MSFDASPDTFDDLLGASDLMAIDENLSHIDHRLFGLGDHSEPQLHWLAVSQRSHEFVVEQQLG